MTKLLLHGCCADCTYKFIRSLDLAETDVTVFYYNPNIHPKTEYLARLKAIQTVCSELKIQLIIPNWRPKEYFESIPIKQKPACRQARPGRCYQCWQLRLEAAAKYAGEHGFPVFSSTLLSSQYQDKEYIIKSGQKVALNNSLEFYVPDNIPQELKTTGFYRQNYCGCCYSLVERMEEKFLS